MVLFIFLGLIKIFWSCILICCNDFVLSHFFALHRAINGVKDMVGFRQTFNLSYSDGNDSMLCDIDVEASSTLVWDNTL